MSWFQDTLAQLAELGTRPGDPPETLRAAAFANILAALVSLGGVIMALMSATVSPALGVVMLAISGGYILPFLLLHAHAPNAVRLYIVLYQNVVAFVMFYALGALAGTHLVLFFTVGTPFFLFARERHFHIAVGIGSALLAFFVPVWMPDLLTGIVPSFPLGTPQLLLLRSTGALLTFSVILIQLYYLKAQYERSERRLLACVDNTGQLLKIACHDMASPLAVLNTALEIHERELDGREPDRAHVLLKRTSVRIQNLLTVIRKLHAVEGARVDLQPVALADAVKASIAGMADTLESKHIAFEMEGLTGDLTVMGDWTIMTESILANVLSNAVKFSRRGDTVRVVAAHDHKGVVLTVADHGIGMPLDLVRGATRGEVLPSRPGTEGEGGSGFGLSLVRAFMAKLGGRVVIESNTDAASPGSGLGTTVHLFFQDAHAAGR